MHCEYILQLIQIIRQNKMDIERTNEDAISLPLRFINRIKLRFSKIVSPFLYRL